MRKYFAPLGIFAGGQLVLLFALMLFPALKTTGDQLAADTAAVASTFWGWTWAVSGLRLWVFLAIELTTLFLAGKAFLGLR